MIAAVVVAGCGGAQPAGPFPPRPADIDLAALDLCALLTPEQQQERGVATGEAEDVMLASGPSRSCSWGNDEDVVSYTVQTVERAASAAVDSPGSSVETVGGYGAVRVSAMAGSAPLCELYLDTSAYDSLRVQVLSLGGTDQVCRMASDAASDVIMNVRSAG